MMNDLLDKALMLTPYRRFAGILAIFFLLLAGGSGLSKGQTRIYVMALLASLGLWLILKGAQFVIARQFYEWEVGITYFGRYAVAVGWASIIFGGLLILFAFLGIIFYLRP